MSNENTPKKVIFAPGCFDNIEVDSQEELDAIVAEVTKIFETLTPEELFEQSKEIDLDELAEAMGVDPEDIVDMIETLEKPNRPLQ